MAGKGKKGQKKGCIGTAAVVIVLVLEFLCLFFMALGSPFDQITLNEDEHDTLFPNYAEGHRECYSVWGRKKCGGSHAPTWHGAFYKFCGVFEAVMKAAASFSIISIGLFGFTIIGTFMLLCKCIDSKIPIMLLTFFGFIASCVPWACIAGLYHNPTCGEFVGPLKRRGKYAPGFAFFIVSWGLQLFAFIFACLI